MVWCTIWIIVFTVLSTREWTRQKCKGSGTLLWMWPIRLRFFLQKFTGCQCQHKEKVYSASFQLSCLKIFLIYILSIHRGEWVSDSQWVKSGWLLCFVYLPFDDSGVKIQAAELTSYFLSSEKRMPIHIGCQMNVECAINWKHLQTHTSVCQQ